MEKVKLPALKLTRPILCGGEIERIKADDGLFLQFEWDYHKSIPVIIVRAINGKEFNFIALFNLGDEFKWLRNARTHTKLEWTDIAFNESVGAYDLEKTINIGLESLYNSYLKNNVS